MEGTDLHVRICCGTEGRFCEVSFHIAVSDALCRARSVPPVLNRLNHTQDRESWQWRLWTPQPSQTDGASDLFTRCGWLRVSQDHMDAELGQFHSSCERMSEGQSGGEMVERVREVEKRSSKTLAYLPACLLNGETRKALKFRFLGAACKGPGTICISGGGARALERSEMADEVDVDLQILERLRARPRGNRCKST